MANSFRHPNWAELYTPITPQILDLFERMRVEHGSWRNVCAISKTRLKTMRNLRRGNRKCISQRLLDRLCSSTEVGSVNEFTWFTADDLIALGIWKRTLYVEGYKRTQADKVYYGTGKKKPVPEKIVKRHEQTLLDDGLISIEGLWE